MSTLIDLSFATHPVLFIVLVFLGIAFLLQLVYYWFLFFRLSMHRDRLTGPVSSVSVVICARNEYNHLKENLPRILEQDHPDFEVVVVNHVSDDDSSFLLTRLAEQYPRLKVIEIKENLNFFSGKKFPLSIGIKSAKNEVILLTDADCRPSSMSWLKSMQSSFDGDAEVVLGYGAYMRHGGFLNKLIRFDTAHIATQYLSCAIAGIPYMGVGRNLAYLKSLFYRNNGFISHYKLASGDDDLFINRVATRTNTRVVLDKGSFTVSDPKRSFRHWFYQKKRHLSASAHYKTKHKVMLGLYALSTVLFYALFILLLAMGYNPLVVLSLVFLRLVSQYVVFGKAFLRLGEKDVILFVPIFELSLLAVNALVYFSNLMVRPGKWN